MLRRAIDFSSSIEFQSDDGNNEQDKNHQQNSANGRKKVLFFGKYFFHPPPLSQFSQDHCLSIRPDLPKPWRPMQLPKLVKSPLKGSLCKSGYPGFLLSFSPRTDKSHGRRMNPN
jgi:hypothetical protein